MKILLANPRGFCAGVDRAIKALEDTLTTYGPPIYVRHEIIHNKPIIADFTRRGVIFVDDVDAIPTGAIALFSAHGVPKRVYDAAQNRDLQSIDATCPLVSKVHHEARRYAAKGYHILLVGHRGHVEVEGTLGHAPAKNITLVDGLAEAQHVQPPQTEKLAVLSQTTLSVDETREIIAVLTQRFPQLVTPSKQDICYATQNRQDAVKQLAPQVDVMLVVGSVTSSNSNRLKETALACGCPQAYLIDGAADLIPEMTASAQTVGITGGASAPEHLIQEVIHALQPSSIMELTVREEILSFQPPKGLSPRVHITPTEEAHG